MSAPPPSDTPAEPRNGNGCLLAFLLMVGVGLLLPGLCAVVFALSEAGDLFRDAGIAALWVVSLAAGGAGVFLIGRARRIAGYPKRQDET